MAFFSSPPPADPNTEDREHEELEQIPWGMLSAELGGSRRFTTGAIALAAVAVVVAAVVGLTVLRSTPETVEITTADVTEAVASPISPGSSPPGSEETSPSSAQPEEGGTGDSLASPTPDAPAPSLYSEADLMAVLPETDLRLAAVTAERLVADLFTIDGVDGAEPLLPKGVPGQEVGPDGGSSWVEWTHTAAVEPTDPGAYEVTVMFRIMAGDSSGGFTRMPVRAVAVPVVMDDEGNAAVADLPSPVDPPEAAVQPLQLGDEEPAPDEVVEAALGQAGWLSNEAEVVATHRSDGMWRVTLLVADAAGNRVPLVAHIASLD